MQKGGSSETVTRQKVLDVFLSEFSQPTQIFDDHLTTHRLFVYDLYGILSRDDGLRLRRRCNRARITRHANCSRLRTRYANSRSRCFWMRCFSILLISFVLSRSTIPSDTKMSRNRPHDGQCATTRPYDVFVSAGHRQIDDDQFFVQEVSVVCCKRFCEHM